SETIHYEKSGKDWYEITDVIQDGKVIKTNKRIMSAEESYFLRVQEDPSYEVEKSVDSVETIDANSDTWNYMTSDQNPESKYTIHYTINKNDTTPYYYDTGIRVNNKKEASYEQYKDILLVLADKTGGYL